jgi:hypothetical protein
MPDLVMLLAYQAAKPAVRPLDSKGYIVRLCTETDMVVTLVPSVVAGATDAATVSGRGDPVLRADADDLGQRDASAPTTTTVVTETPDARIRGV